ncbi:dienelactone hydrolase family protein [Bradyrhizobium diazoefficiens]|nr:dienelactone hydrolase family protein [Bradyrhizobium diazoefficiens]MBR0773223.1 dienelactone hydrolase family protein [Bradyrhizobium diazoefficiens]
MRILKAAFFALAVMTTPAHAEDTWTVTRDIALTSRPRFGAVREEKIIADLFRPNRGGRLPAVVIMNSSGGVLPFVEMNYANVLAANGAIALVVDSFMPRGVRRTSDDQTRVSYVQSIADAVAGYQWLASQSFVDPARIVVMGMSKGAAVAVDTAGLASRQLFGATEARFAAHVAVAPGCEFQNQDAKTTGAPIFFMIAELDNYTPARHCLEYADRIRSAGNAKVRLAVYPGVYHAYEWTAGVMEENNETWIKCFYFRNERGQLTDRATGKIVAPAGGLAVERQCMDTRPVNVGGDARVKAQAIADLLQFLRDIRILDDADAQAIVPDCAQIAKLRMNCERARAGWGGDMLALARAYRAGKDVPHDDVLAEKLLKLAAGRGHPQAQMDLADLYVFGPAGQRNPARALELASSAAAAGEGGAMNILGVMAREGIGRGSDAKEALMWFRKAADLRNPYALAHLGRMYWDGRAGLAMDPAEAVRLWQRSTYYGNPWGQLYLAEALERGEGIARDRKAAVDRYRAAAGQTYQPEAKRRATDALARLGEATP